MDVKKQKELIDSYIADFYSLYLDHTDDLSQPVTFEHMDKTMLDLTHTLNKCFELIIDSQNQ